MIARLAAALDPASPPVWALCLTAVTLLAPGLWRRPGGGRLFLAVLMLQVGLFGLARRGGAAAAIGGPAPSAPPTIIDDGVLLPLPMPPSGPTHRIAEGIGIGLDMPGPGTARHGFVGDTPPLPPPPDLGADAAVGFGPPPTAVADAAPMAFSLPPPAIDASVKLDMAPSAPAAGSIDGLGARPPPILGPAGPASPDVVATMPPPVGGAGSPVVDGRLDPGLPGVEAGYDSFALLGTSISNEFFTFKVRAGHSVVIVIDVSSSMVTGKNSSGQSRFDRVRWRLIEIIRTLPIGTEFQVLFFDQGMRWFMADGTLSQRVVKKDGNWAPELLQFDMSTSQPLEEPKILRLTDGLRQACINTIQAMPSGSSTEPVPALEMAFRLAPREVLMLTDGEFDASPQQMSALDGANTKKIPVRGTLLGDTLDPPAPGAFDEITKKYGGKSPHYVKD